MANEIILLRGLFRGSYHWGDFPELLQSELPDKVVTCIDIPGNGELSSQVSPSTIPAMVEAIRLQRETSNKVHILAISMGGMIALKWAELYPSEVESLICVNTTAKGFSPFYQRLQPKNYLKIVQALISNSVQREKIIYSMVSNQQLNVDVVAGWAGYGERHPMRASNFWRQLVAATQFDVTRPASHLYFISSEKDNLVSSKATKAIAKAWKAPLIINEHDGHDIALDNPQWLLKKVVVTLDKAE
ncbi:hydrolase [Photobacterium sanctipauli]|uniref:Hydrolase n=1 Tax=Photobacterium sanctipauli TaxID=1342794 RepID=A0A2T3NN03_9GAMM|nr:alpha/beta fold hydrolase [Photobacterium sanctipauli]PSW16895.1 hydrolase [Photobacterium sanctipauli]